MRGAMDSERGRDPTEVSLPSWNARGVPTLARICSHESRQPDDAHVLGQDQLVSSEAPLVSLLEGGAQAVKTKGRTQLFSRRPHLLVEAVMMCEPGRDEGSRQLPKPSAEKRGLAVMTPTTTTWGVSGGGPLASRRGGFFLEREREREKGCVCACLLCGRGRMAGWLAGQTADGVVRRESRSVGRWAMGDGRWENGDGRWERLVGREPSRWHKLSLETGTPTTKLLLRGEA